MHALGEEWATSTDLQFGGESFHVGHLFTSPATVRCPLGRSSAAAVVFFSGSPPTMFRRVHLTLSKKLATALSQQIPDVDQVQSDTRDYFHFTSSLPRAWIANPICNRINEFVGESKIAVVSGHNTHGVRHPRL